METLSVKSIQQTYLNTIADLRALPVGPESCPVILGYHMPDDGGGGQFYWDTTSTAEENGGTVIRPNTVPASEAGRWRRLGEPHLSVKALGAIGDGKSHPLENFYSTLCDAKAVYPHIETHKTSLDTDDDWWKSLELDWVAIQGAIDIFAHEPLKYSAISVPPGHYKLERPLIIGRYNRHSPRCHLIGVPNAYPTTHIPSVSGTIIELSSFTLPTLIIQGTRVVSATGIVFLNGNTAPSTKRPTLGDEWNSAFFNTDPNSWLSEYEEDGQKKLVRDNPYSPQAVIAIDPFANQLPKNNPANAYPGYEDYYGGATWPNPGYSSAITFRQCGFQGGVVGVAVAPCPGVANNENYVFEHCFWVHNKTHLAIGHSQARAIKLDSPRMYGCHIAIDSQQYGIGDALPGQHPIITGAPNIGGCQYFLNVNTVSQVLNIENAHFESMLSLGWIGHGLSGSNSGALFTGCNFNFLETRTPPYVAIPFHLRTFGQVEFHRCVFSYNGTQQLIRVWNHEGRCFLNKCVLKNGERNGNVMMAFHAYDDRLQIEHVQTYNSSSGPVYEAAPKPGITFVPINKNAYVQVVQNGTPDKGTITVTDTTGLQIGDVLALTASPTQIQPEHYPIWPAPDDFENAYPYAFDQPIGVITKITPNAEIELDNLPQDFPFNQNLRLQAIRWDIA